MPRYYFDIENGHRLPDPCGVDLPDDRAAAEQAGAIAAQIVKDVPDISVKRHVAVRDEDGNDVTSVGIKK